MCMSTTNLVIGLLRPNLSRIWDAVFASWRRCSARFATSSSKPKHTRRIPCQRTTVFLGTPSTPPMKSTSSWTRNGGKSFVIVEFFVDASHSHERNYQAYVVIDQLIPGLAAKIASLELTEKAGYFTLVCVGLSNVPDANLRTAPEGGQRRAE